MKDVGHLYVLANSAMPGLVKIGKTTRSPADRAAELSGVTGLPTPFIVVYEQLFQSCTEAENFVHTFLATKGFRVSESREFFNAPVNDVIRAIISAPGAIDPDTKLGSNSSKTALMQVAPQFSESPGDAIYEQADSLYYGHGDDIQDDRGALKLFIQAARLGSNVAYERIGHMYVYGEGVTEDHKVAMTFFKEGVAKGNHRCYWHMGVLLWSPSDESKRNRSNAEKSFALYRRALLDKVNEDEGRCFRNVWGLNKVHRDCFKVVLYNEFFAKPTDFPEPLVWLLSFHASSMVDFARDRVEGAERRGVDIDLLEGYRKVLRYFERLEATELPQSR